MATIKQGVEYEITANDKSEKTLEDAAQNAENAAKKTGDAMKNAGDAGMKGFSPMKAVMSALRGDFAGLTSEASKLLPSFQKAGAGGTAAFGAISAAAFGLIKLFGALAYLVKTVFNFGQAPRDIKAMESGINDLKNQAEGFADEMARARENSERQTKMYEDQVNALARLTKAQNEFNRAQELALAKSDEEKAEINRRYNSANSMTDDEAAEMLRLNKRLDLEDEGARIREEIAEAKRMASEYQKIQKDANKALNENATGFLGDMWAGIKEKFTGKVSGNKKADAAFNASVNARNSYEEQMDKIEELEKKLEENQHALEIADLEEKAAIEEHLARKQVEWTEEIAAVDEQNQKQAERNAAEIAEAEKRAEEEVQRLRLADIQEAKAKYLQSVDERGAAERRLAAAQSNVTQAWGWYRDKDSMARQLEEEKANAEAEVQFEKDFARLRRFRPSDWRNAKNLSVDEEAVRRVALAREEEQNARKELEQIGQNTAYLEDIYNLMSGEDS